MIGEGEGCIGYGAAGGKTTGSEVALAGLVQSLRHPGGWESTTI